MRQNKKSLPPETISRLSKCLGMLGSNFDGEILAAARAANALVRGEGFTWEEILAPLALPRNDGAGSRSEQTIASWQKNAKACLDRAHLLNEWELEFAHSMSEQTYQPTVRQAEKLAQIMQKCGVKGSI